MMGIEENRKAIDRINREMASLFCERMEAAEQIAAYKKEKGLPILDPAREREILERMEGEAPPARRRYIRAYFASLMEISRAYQAELNLAESAASREIRLALSDDPAELPKGGRVACQGVEGAYSQIACKRLFKEPEIVYFKNFNAVFSAVQSGLCDYGILPIENSTHGSVSEVYDLMRRHDFRIVSSLKLEVEHALLAPDGAALSDIREIRSHAQALGQCSHFLDAHPEIRFAAAENTATAAREIARLGRRDTAVIASPACAELYGLVPIRTKIMNAKSNRTRFICIARETRIARGASRISLMLTLANTAGALHSVLSRFASAGFNLVKLESRPIPDTDFAFRFYLDFETPFADALYPILDWLSETAQDLTFLGFYPDL